MCIIIDSQVDVPACGRDYDESQVGFPTMNRSW